MEYHTIRRGTDEGTGTANVGGFLPDAFARLLELRPWLAGRGDGDDLARSLEELAGPRPVQTEIPMTMQLVDDAESRDHSVTRAVIGRKYLDASTFVVVDASVAFQANEARHVRLELPFGLLDVRMHQRVLGRRA